MDRKALSEQIVASSLFSAELMGEVYKPPNLIRGVVDRRKQNEEVASEIFNNAMEKLTVDYLGDTDKFKQALDYISDNPTESLINAITIKETNPKARKVFRFDELKAIGQKMGFKQGDFIKERDKALSVAKGQQGNIELYKHTTERFVGNKPWRVATKWERQRAMRGELKTYYRTSSKSYKVFTLDQTNLKPELHDSFFPDNKIDFNDEAQVHAVRKGLMNYAMSLEDKINANIEKNNLNRSGKYSDRVSEPIAIRIMDDKKLKPGEPGRYEVKDNLRLIRLNANDSPRDLVRTEFKLLAKASADYGAPQNSKINVGDKVRADFEKKAATDEAMINYVLDKRYGLGDEPLSDREWTKRLKAYTQVEKDIRRHSNRIQNIVSGVSSEVDKSVNGLRMNERVIAPQQNLERGISM
ncbi:hypothetical protein V3C97_03305 [Ligilactobacillus saerimneri]|uniref:hypothetical protein n=1 Tax=Ligilactobacillus saerimneri TaxID=228229 RepID=UPI0030CFEF99